MNKTKLQMRQLVKFAYPDKTKEERKVIEKALEIVGLTEIIKALLKR